MDVYSQTQQFVLLAATESLVQGHNSLIWSGSGMHV